MVKNLLQHAWEPDFKVNFCRLWKTRGDIKNWEIRVIAIKVHEIHCLMKVYLKLFEHAVDLCSVLNIFIPVQCINLFGFSPIKKTFYINFIYCRDIFGPRLSLSLSSWIYKFYRNVAYIINIDGHHNGDISGSRPSVVWVISESILWRKNMLIN